MGSGATHCFSNPIHLTDLSVNLFFDFSLCLKAFSWISVLEILRAAVVMLKPIRSGTVKAQAKGIIRDIHNAGHSSAVGRGSLPAGKNYFIYREILSMFCNYLFLHEISITPYHHYNPIITVGISSPFHLTLLHGLYDG